MAINWTSGLLSGYGLYDQLDRLSNISDKAVEGTNQLADQAMSQTQFKPFTVTSGLGTSRTDANGNLNYELNPYLQAASNDYFGQANSLFSSITQPTGVREQDIYDRIRATQMPEEQRAQDMMDARLTAQGRSGIRSAAYGGTPEQLAYHKAVQEAQDNASLMALQQAMAERNQNAQLGGMLQNAAFTPYAQSQNLFNQGLQTQQLKQAADMAGANYLSQLGLGGLQTSLNADVARGNLIGNAINSASSAIGSTDFDPIGGLFEKILKGMGI